MDLLWPIVVEPITTIDRLPQNSPEKKNKTKTKPNPKKKKIHFNII